MLIRDGYVKACDTATLGQMGDAFFSSPKWTSFTSVDNETIVEVDGGISYQGSPADAVLQFTVTDLGTSFKASYFGVNDEGQGLLVMSGLLTKMCNAV